MGNHKLACIDANATHEDVFRAGASKTVTWTFIDLGKGSLRMVTNP